MSAKQNEDDIQLQHRGHKPSDVGAETIEAIDPDADKPRAHGDKAAEFLEANAPGHEHMVITPEENKRILRKIDLALLPILLCIYFLQSLDKTALSYAAVFGLIDDTNLVGDQYSWLGAIVYVAQLIWQPVVAYFLVKLPTGKFLASMVFCWYDLFPRSHRSQCLRSQGRRSLRYDCLQGLRWAHGDPILARLI